tara:strand:+ start:849 stop:1277 length:429 start_codon:yes stop_codon:yes gene_type:complete
MTLVNVRAAFEKAITDSIIDVDPRVKIMYDNVPFTSPGKTVTYVTTSITFSQSTLQAQGVAADYYSGAIQANVYVPKNKGSAKLSAICESVIDALNTINASDYADPFSCSPRVGEVSGPIPVEIEDRSHFLGIVSCSFFANS